MRSVRFPLPPIHVDTLFFLGTPTLSSCPFHVMALGIKMALLFENKMSFAALTAEAFLIPLDTCSIAPSSFLSRLPQLFSDSASYCPVVVNLTWNTPMVTKSILERLLPAFQRLHHSFSCPWVPVTIIQDLLWTLSPSSHVAFLLLPCLSCLPASEFHYLALQSMPTCTLAPTWHTLTWNTQVTGPNGLRSLACTLWTGTVIYLLCLDGLSYTLQANIMSSS